MTGGGDNNRCVYGIWIHTGLVVVVHSDESPVGDDTGDAEGSVWVGSGDEVFDCGGVEEFDVGEREHFGEEGGGEECLSIKY